MGPATLLRNDFSILEPKLQPDGSASVSGYGRLPSAARRGVRESFETRPPGNPRLADGRSFHWRARRRRGNLQNIDNFMCLSAFPLQNERVMIEEPLGPRLIEPVLIPDGAPFPQYT